MIFDQPRHGGKRLQIIGLDSSYGREDAVVDARDIKPRVWEYTSFKVTSRSWDDIVVHATDSADYAVIETADIVRPFKDSDIIISQMTFGGQITLLNVAEGGTWSCIDKHKNSKLYTVRDGVIRRLTPQETEAARRDVGLQRRAAAKKAPDAPVAVTRHSELIRYMIETGIMPADAETYQHISDPEIIRGRHVYGTLPLHLAACAETLTVVPIRFPPHKRVGDDLSMEEIKMGAKPPQTYVIRLVRGGK